jgi:hypothetical protein
MKNVTINVGETEILNSTSFPSFNSPVASAVRQDQSSGQVASPKPETRNPRSGQGTDTRSLFSLLTTLSSLPCPYDRRLINQSRLSGFRPSSLLVYDK